MALAVDWPLPRAPAVWFAAPRAGAPSPLPPLGKGLLIKFVNLTVLAFVIEFPA